MCSCGLKTNSIKMIEGRSDDILYFENQNKDIIKIFPDFFRRAIITSNENINNYYLIQKKIDSLSLFINGGPEIYNDAKNRILNLLRSKKIENVKICQLKNFNLKPGEKLIRVKNAIGKKS